MKYISFAVSVYMKDMIILPDTPNTCTSHNDRPIASLPVLVILTILPVTPGKQEMRRVSLNDRDCSAA